MSTDFIKALRVAQAARGEVPRESLGEVREERDAFLGLLAAERANGVALTRYGRDINDLRGVERLECEDAACAALWEWVSSGDEQVTVLRDLARRQDRGWVQR